MEIKFQEAARRHFQDAEMLKEAKRMPNADHLYGLAAECALKAVMVALGVPTRTDGDIDDRTHRVHVNTLWEQFKVFADGREGARYVSPIPSDNPFADWDVSQRYAGDDHVSAKAVIEHSKGARAVMVALARAVADGKIL